MKSNLILLLCIICNFSFGQPNSYVKYFGSSQLNSYGHGVYQASSGSIYLAGYGNDLTSLYSLISFTKLDDSGNEIYTKYFGDSLHHFMLMRMLAIDDNKFLLVGSKMVNGGNNNPYFLFVDSMGSAIRESSILSSINSWFSGVSQFQNGNFAFTGAASDSINGDLNLTGVITDSLGNILHSFSFGDVGLNETSENCVITNDGNVIVCGDKLISPSIVNPFVVSFDSTGSYLWDMTISSHLNSGSKNLYIDRNNDLIVIGESATDSSAQFDIQMTKINASTGLQIWMKLIPGTDMSDAGFAMSETIDGNYALTGYGYDSILNAKRIVMIITDTSGTELSKQYFGNSTINIGYDICPSVYGGFLIAGADFVNNQEVLVYQKELGIGINDIDNTKVSFYPNPANGNSEIHFSIPFDKLSIYDISGKLVTTENDLGFRNDFLLPTLKKGTYFIKLELNGKKFQSNLIIAE